MGYMLHDVGLWMILVWAASACALELRCRGLGWCGWLLFVTTFSMAVAIVGGYI